MRRMTSGREKTVSWTAPANTQHLASVGLPRKSQTINDWLGRVHDPRFKPFITYDKRFLVWWGICLYLFQLGSRRQLDFDLDARSTHVLENLNRLAQTEQETRPVHKTLHYFLGRSGCASCARLRTSMLGRLIRMKALDAARLQGRFVVPLDATGHVCFRRPHCPHCLVTRHEHYTPISAEANSVTLCSRKPRKTQEEPRRAS